MKRSHFHESGTMNVKGSRGAREAQRAHYCDVLKLIENPTGVASTASSDKKGRGLTTTL